MSNKPDINNLEIEERLEISYKAIEEAVVGFSSMSKEAFFENAFNSAFDLIPSAEKGSLYEREKGLFKPILSRGYDIGLLSELEFDIDSLFIGFEVDDHKKIHVYEFYNRKRDDAKFTEREIEIFKALGTYNEFTSIYAPIILENETIGLLCFERFDGLSYSSSSKHLLKIYAELISKFYAQMVAQDRERHQYQEIIDAMVSAIEIKDIYTEGHGQRVRELATGLAQYMALSADDIDKIGVAAVLHDIGKIGIPTDILVKPSRLTDEEYELIKEHPTFTKRILENISGFSQVVEIAYQHHEYYNGRGYPEGVSGEAIHLESAIIAVADAFDAMTADRSYRKAMSKDRALSIIQEERGAQFHPKVVDAFLKWQMTVET